MTKVYVVSENDCNECGQGYVLFVLSENQQDLAHKLENEEIRLTEHGEVVTERENNEILQCRSCKEVQTKFSYFSVNGEGAE